jgi:hypothetical protein
MLQDRVVNDCITITFLLRASAKVVAMQHSIDPARYHAYLLRLWQTGEDEAVAWRVLLEDPRTGERRGFADLDSLFAFLNEMCRDNSVDH